MKKDIRLREIEYLVTTRVVKKIYRENLSNLT